MVNSSYRQTKDIMSLTIGLKISKNRGTVSFKPHILQKTINNQEQSVLIMIIDRILPIYMSLMLIFSLSFIVHLEVILNLWMKNYLCTVFWRFVSKEEAMEANLICYQNFKRVIWGQYGSVYYDNFVVVSCI